jgi:integrase
VFLPWCARHGIHRISEITTRSLEQFSTQLLEEGGKRGELSRNTVWTYVKAVRNLVAWAKAEGEKVEAEARLPSLPRRLIEVLSREEIQRIEDSADSERDKLIVRVLADTGVRVGELIKLREGDLVERDRMHYLRVLGRSQGGGAKGEPVPPCADLACPGATDSALCRAVEAPRGKQRPALHFSPPIEIRWVRRTDRQRSPAVHT